MAGKTKVFIACDIPEVVRKKCAQIQTQLAEELPKVKWVNPTQMHITLLFLGDVNDKQLYEACSMAKKALSVIPAFTFCLKGFGCFPTPRRPRVLWLGVDEKSRDNFLKIHEQLASAISLNGWFREERKSFSPHLTLARINQEMDLSVFISRWKIEPWVSEEIQIKEIQIYSSTLGQDGPEYGKLSKIALK